MKIGARVFKTGLAVIVALYVSLALGLEPPVFAAIAAVISIQPSIYRSITTFIEQIKANVIGALLALIAVLLLGNSPIVVGITVIIIIFVNLLLKYEKSISISVLTAIAIMESATDSFAEFAWQRFVLIIIGMLSATLINALFIPPKHEGKIAELLEDTNKELIKLMQNRNTDSFVARTEEIAKNIKSLETLFAMYREEVFFHRFRYQKKRELVTYKLIISLFKKELKLLRYLKQMKDEFAITMMDQRLKGIAHVQKDLLQEHTKEVKRISDTLPFQQYDMKLLRPISLVIDIEQEVNKVYRYKVKKARKQMQNLV